MSIAIPSRFSVITVPEDLMLAVTRLPSTMEKDAYYSKEPGMDDIVALLKEGFRWVRSDTNECGQRYAVLEKSHFNWWDDCHQDKHCTS